MNLYNIALDGPAGAGKSTAARMMAKALGFIYVDTGAMYRAVTWTVLQQGIEPADEIQVAQLAKQLQIELRPGENGQQVLVNGVDVTGDIRSQIVNQNVSTIAQNPEVREVLVKLQKDMAHRKGVVMDGRDIGTNVLPDAEVKIYLTATVHERALRRYKEMKDPSISLEQLEQEIAERDRMDQERETSPLRQAADAILLDSTYMNLTEVVEEMLSICRAKVNGSVYP